MPRAIVYSKLFELAQIFGLLYVNPCNANVIQACPWLFDWCGAVVGGGRYLLGFNPTKDMTMDPADTALAYTISQATRVAGIGRSKLYLEMASGRLRARRLGRRVLIEASELRRFLASLPDARPSKPGVA
jgi:excisionase family DNA binding protein